MTPSREVEVKEKNVQKSETAAKAHKAGNEKFNPQPVTSSREVEVKEKNVRKNPSTKGESLKWSPSKAAGAEAHSIAKREKSLVSADNEDMENVIKSIEFTKLDENSKSKAQKV